jgi:hypothetical protein
LKALFPFEIAKTLDTPELEFRGGKKALDPVQAFAISSHKPYKIPSIEKSAELILLVPEKYEFRSEAEEMLRDLERGWTQTIFPRSRYPPPFNQTYDINIERKETKEYESLSDINAEINRIANLLDRHLHILVIVSKQRSAIGEFYYQVKVNSIPKRVHTQIILDATIRKYFQSNYQKGDLLWNLSLSVFSKLGGIPWRLSNRLSGICAFLCLTTIATSTVAGIVRRKGIAAFEIVNSWGEHIGRTFAEAKVEPDKLQRGALSINPDTVSNLVDGALNNVEKSASDVEQAKKNDNVIIHMTDRYSKTVYDAITERLSKKGFEKYKILHIQERGPLRLYNPDAARSREAWPKEGSYWYLEKGNIAFCYTMGRWPYSTVLEREPYVISPHSVSPIQVNFVRGSKDSTLNKSDLEHIYNLTRLHYYSADIPRIKMPSTTRLGRRAALLAASGLNIQDFDASYLY